MKQILKMAHFCITLDLMLSNLKQLFEHLNTHIQHMQIRIIFYITIFSSAAANDDIYDDVATGTAQGIHI